MSDCKYKKTYDALKECLDQMDEDNSNMEIENARRLYVLCKIFISNCNKYGIHRKCDGEYELFDDD